MKALIMQCPPTSYYCIPVRHKYTLQHPVLKYLQSMFFPYVKLNVARSTILTMEMSAEREFLHWLNRPACRLFKDDD
jgi:hypothetical protein